MTAGSWISCMDFILKRGFLHLGIFIGKHPGYFIIVPVFLTLLCMTGYQHMKYEIDPEYLFSPINGQAQATRANVEKYFKMNYTNRFNAERLTRPGRFGRVIATAKDGNDNMLRHPIFMELQRLDDLIQNATVDCDGETFTYEDLCAKWENECFLNDFLSLENIMDEVETGQVDLTFPFMINPVTWNPHMFPIFFGGTKRTKDNIITSVPAVQLLYFLNSDNKRSDAKAAKWEEKFLEIVSHAENSGLLKHISIAYFASRTLDYEMEKNTLSVVQYFGSTFLLMAFFSVITCIMGDAVRSKPCLGLLGNISAVMATVAAFGFAMYMGIEFIGINLAAPFLMIGIGIDDTFVMLAAWRRTSPELSVPERMGRTMSEAAVSITITSLTNMISFFIGVISPFRSVQIFCSYSGFAVVFTFLWHVTFFGACMAVSGYREQKNLHAIFGFRVQPMSVAIKEKRNCLYKAFLAGGINRDDPDNPIDNKDHMLMAFFKYNLTVVINNKWCKLLIIMTFAAYLGGACFGITQIKEGLDRRKLSHPDSYAVEFFNREDKYYGEFPYRIQVLIDGETQYSSQLVQSQLETLTHRLEATPYISSSGYTESWMRSFISFYEQSEYSGNVSINDEEAFVENLKELWLTSYNQFTLDLRFNENGTKILASRFFIQAVNITHTNQAREMVQHLRQICKDSPLNASIFHPYFIFFDQYDLVRPTSLQAMVIGALTMMVISFIFIPNILCSLWVAFSVISIELGVAGYMALWDVNLDSISMINLIMCIGFSVDFTAHICYTYMSSKKKYPSARVRESLYSLGLPILQGSISSILGIVALLLAESYIFMVFFKMVFLVIFFGAMHALFLLPVLLSLFGPGSLQTWTGRDNGSDEDKTSKSNNDFTPHPFYVSYPQMGVNSTFESKRYLWDGEEKDLGIGSSEDCFSESSSNRSHLVKGRQQFAHHDFLYSNSQSQFYPNPELHGKRQTMLEWRTQLEEEQRQKQRQLTLQRHQLPAKMFAKDRSRGRFRQTDARNNYQASSSTAKRCNRRRSSEDLRLQQLQRLAYPNVHLYSTPEYFPYHAMSHRPHSGRSLSHHNLYYPPHVPHVAYYQ